MKPITFTSTLSKKDIYLTMKNLTNTNVDEPLFVGTVTEDGFSVTKHRLLHRRVLLDPQLKATVNENDNGTEISIKASLTKLDKIGFSVFGLLILGIIIYMIANAIATSSLEPLAPIIAIIIFEALFSLIDIFIFALRAKRIIKNLKKHLT